MNEEVFNWDEFMNLCSTGYEGYEHVQKDYIRSSLFSWFKKKREEGCTISIARTKLDYNSYTTYFPDSSSSYREESRRFDPISYTVNLGKLESFYSNLFAPVENSKGGKELLLRKNDDYIVGKIIYKQKETDEKLVDYIKLETENMNLNFMMIDTELTDHFYDMLEYALVCLMD